MYYTGDSDHFNYDGIANAGSLTCFKMDALANVSCFGSSAAGGLSADCSSMSSVS